MRISLSTQGASPAARRLDQLAGKLRSSPREPLEQIGQRFVEIFRERFDRAGGSVSWPPRSAISRRLRPGQLMRVTGSLRQDLRADLEGDSAVVAGSPSSPRARALAFGSRQSDRALFPGAIIPARPWAVLDTEHLDEAVATLTDYYFEANAS